MKPLMLIPPAQAEALYDAHLETQEAAAQPERPAPTPWLDEDASDDDARPPDFLRPTDFLPSADFFRRPQRPALA